MTFVMDDRPVEGVWKIRRGDDVVRRQRLYYTIDGQRVDVDLTNWTIAGEVRSTADSSTVLGDITGTPDADQAANKGVYTLALSGAETADFPETAVADVEFTDEDAVTKTLIAFDVYTDPDVTRPA